MNEHITIMQVMKKVAPIMNAYEEAFGVGIHHSELSSLIGFLLLAAGTDAAQSADVVNDALGFRASFPGAKT